MLKGLSALDQMEIVGVDNVVDFANKVFKNQYIAPSVLIFKYKYAQLKEAIAVSNSSTTFYVNKYNYRNF